MKKNTHFTVTVLLLCTFLMQAAGATQLLETQTSWDGGALAYPQGPVKITSFILRQEEGLSLIHI